MTTEKIYVQIDNNKFELTGADKQSFIADRQIRQSELDAFEKEKTAKAEAKLVAQAKLEALGLTVEDLTALGL